MPRSLLEVIVKYKHFINYKFSATTSKSDKRGLPFRCSSRELFIAQVFCFLKYYALGHVLKFPREYNFFCYISN